MSQIMLVPFNDQQIGQGFNFDSRESVGTGLTVASISEDAVADGQIVRTSFNSVTTQESLMESLGMSASADARYAGGIGGQAKFTGPDAKKILERLNEFPQSAHDHPVGYEVELATYDTIPITVITPEEREDRNIVLADCLAQKMGFLKALSDLQFALGPNGRVFFDELPAPEELAKMERLYRGALNGLMAHAIKVATGKLNPPQLFQADPIPPPLGFKKKPVSDDDKVNHANRGEAIARTDALVAAFLKLERTDLRKRGFNIGMAITEGHTLWGPGKQRMLDSLSFEEQIGFKDAAIFSLLRNNNASLAAKGADIADADPEVAAARALRASGLFWLGFDIATALFGDPALGALGSTLMGSGSHKIRSSLTEVEHVLLPTEEAKKGFDASMTFHLGRKH